MAVKWIDIRVEENKSGLTCEFRLKLEDVIIADNILSTCNFEQAKNGGVAFCW